ncbi:RelA/SpoT family protein [Microgenomates group bacterium]|nr:RelA/SpoT family protein [Microgenomates group bacterium]
MEEIKEIIELLDSPTSEDITLLERAAAYAQKKHQGQKRFSGEEYFNHCLATAKNLALVKMGATTVAAGLLHDVIEDTDTTAEEIKKEFGEEIWFLVDGVSKLGELRYHGAERYNQSLRKLFVATAKDIRVLIIKLCDRWHNIVTLDFVSEKKRLRIAKETLEIYAPLAHRLGIYRLQRSLEDGAFKYVYPEDYERAKKLLQEKSHEQEKQLNKLQKEVRRELENNNIKDFEISYRVKSLYSFYKKLKKHHDRAEDIYDVLALRIKLNEIDDCYHALGIIHERWQIVDKRTKDYVALPKANGYRSLHTTIYDDERNIIEMQIRTFLMDREAEYGRASHLLYKKRETSGDAELDYIQSVAVKNKIDRPEWVGQLLKYQEENGMLDSLIKRDVLTEQIFVFTPRGDVVELPAGASVIDFAFRIHTEIGARLVGAEVNGKFVGIDTELKHGDKVKVQTQKNARPTTKWLEHCKTAEARTRVRRELGLAIKRV